MLQPMLYRRPMMSQSSMLGLPFGPQSQQRRGLSLQMRRHRLQHTGGRRKLCIVLKERVAPVQQIQLPALGQLSSMLSRLLHMPLGTELALCTKWHYLDRETRYGQFDPGAGFEAEP